MTILYNEKKNKWKCIYKKLTCIQTRIRTGIVEYFQVVMVFRDFEWKVKKRKHIKSELHVAPI